MLTTLNVEGSALFWVNLDAAGEGRLDLLHAGLPATGGEKVGLNVWTELGVQEVQRRGIFGGQRREFWRPTREFLERYELVRPESEG
jgi:prolyl 4-hydroxylase